MNIVEYIDKQIELLYQLQKTPKMIIFSNEGLRKIFINNLNIQLIHKNKDIELKVVSYKGLPIEVMTGLSTALGNIELPIVTTKTK